MPKRDKKRTEGQIERKPGNKGKAEGRKRKEGPKVRVGRKTNGKERKKARNERRKERKDR